MDSFWRTLLWGQFGAAIDMLENAIRACPDEVWGDRDRHPEFWYTVYHTLFFLDVCLSDSVEGFVPPAPFNLDELDPAGILPERVYTKDEMLSYLDHGRQKCRARIANLTDEQTRQKGGFYWLDLNLAELLIHNLRHVQHHTAQLYLILRQTTDSAPRWVSKTCDPDKMTE
ncbi:MAG TPA: DinB family protein [Acidobacteriota bacterium]|nr:DinB family protein [Acidobacteriota bacterium]